MARFQGSKRPLYARLNLDLLEHPDVCDLSPMELRVFLRLLVSTSANHGGPVDITKGQLVESLSGSKRIHPKTIQKAISGLVSAGLLERRGRAGSNGIKSLVPVYRLRFPKGTFNAHVDKWGEQNDSPDEDQGGEQKYSPHRCKNTPDAGTETLPTQGTTNELAENPLPLEGETEGEDPEDSGTDGAPVPAALLELVWVTMLDHSEAIASTAIFATALAPQSAAGVNLVNNLVEKLFKEYRCPISFEVVPAQWAGTKRRRWMERAVRAAGERFLRSRRS